jgi:TRAP transporter TAXI family solute receptor
MKFWLFRRASSARTAAHGQSADRVMNIESLEHIMRNRMRMILRHTWLVAVVGTLLVIGAVWAAFYVTTQAERLRIAAGPTDTKFVEALSEQITQGHHNLHLRFVPVAGPQEAAEDIKNGKADLAILPSPADNALKAPVVAILRQNVMALIVPPPASGKKGKKSGKIEKIGQLAGHRVGIVTGNEASPELLRTVLDHYGVPAAKVTVSEIDPKNIADAIKNNQVDALFVAGAATGAAISSAVKAASRNGDAPSFVDIDQADGIAKRNPAFDSIDIDAGTFGGTPPTPDDSLKTLSFAQYLVARKSMSDSIIATLAKTIYSSRQALAAALPGEIKIEAPSTDKDADVVTHPGALAYLNDSQQSFFDKYGDDIFYGMLIFPVFGSALAGVASYLRRDTRTRRLRLLQRVLDLVRKAHTAQNLEALEQLQIEADNLVIAIVHQGEREEFDETVRMSFAFALDQLRFTIAARRTAILDHAGEAGEGGAAAKPPGQTAAYGVYS